MPIAYRPDGNPIEYTVFVKDRSLTVTQPDDLSFLQYFYDRCVAADEKTIRIPCAETAFGRTKARKRRRQARALAQQANLIRAS